MNLSAFLSTLSPNAHSLPIVILYVTAGCNLRCITCSYREPLPHELSLDEYKALFPELQRLGVRRIVYSGGEPLLRRDLPEICANAESAGIRQSLLTNGLLLEKRANEIGSFLDEVIISLDGPDAPTHNSIRGLDCFEQIVRGLKVLVATGLRISIRCVVQRRNFRKLGKMVEFANDLGINKISFLAADVRSSAFHRDHAGPVSLPSDILLDEAECVEFRESMKALLEEHASDFQSSFIAESQRKMMHLVEYFEAQHGHSPFPRNECNAPSVSLVITSTGDVLPCYFLPSFGNVRTGSLSDLLNSPGIQSTRSDVRQYRLKECHHCVCTLKMRPFNALLDAF